jgi:serine/threonine-protein kinase HipA
VAIGNADAHGKNLSLLLPPDGRLRLAPLYDVMSTVHYPEVVGPMGLARVSTELAMFIDGEGEIDAVDVPALRCEGERWHFSDDADDRIHGLLARFDDALEAAANAVPRAPDALLERLRARAARLREGLSAGG